MLNILFVCSANQFRSPLAVAFLQDFIHQEQADGKWRVESAGIWAKPGLPASSSAVKVAGWFGLSGLETHLTRVVDKELLDQSDLILVMEVGHLDTIALEFPSAFGRLMMLSEIVDGMPYNIADPADVNGDPEDIATELMKLIQRGGKKILKMAKSLHQARQVLVNSDNK